MKAGDLIKVERVPIYASSSSTLREYTKTVSWYGTLDNGTEVLQFKGGTRRWRRDGEYLNSYYPSNMRLRILEELS